MNELVFYDISFEDFRGNTYEITTMDIDKARYVYERVKGFNNVIVEKRKIYGDNEFRENVLSEIQR